MTFRSEHTTLFHYLHAIVLQAPENTSRCSIKRCGAYSRVDLEGTSASQTCWVRYWEKGGQEHNEKRVGIGVRHGKGGIV